MRGYFFELIRPWQMFKKSEIETVLHARLKAAGLNPLDPPVKGQQRPGQRLLRRKDREGVAAGSGCSQSSNRPVSRPFQMERERQTVPMAFRSGACLLRR